ncbi:MAG: STAS domain-containing protein [Oscillospiraceae bacterium]|jgi:stage II sporulation protein AA (anti-sigma F factor antagonist)|nr:STAS domain-containing protein [Oscillospiraceae bacterium]
MKITKNGRRCTVLLDGDIDHCSARSMREMIDRYVNEEKPEVLCLDFSKIKFMDSSGIGLIMGRYKLIKILGGRLVIAGVSEGISRIIKLSGLGTLGIVKEER